MPRVPSFVQRVIAIAAVFLVGLALTLVVTSPSPQPAEAQTNACPAVVTRALDSVGTACAGLGRNSACYGYRAVSATFANPQPASYFSRVGDTTDLLSLETLRTAPLDIARDQWGVALMNVQASLPNSLPGQNVTFLLLGNAQVENAVAPDSAFRPGIPVNVRTTQATTIQQQPNASSVVVAELAADTAVPADARSADDQWFRVAANGQYGWVQRSALNIPGPAARLPIYAPETNPAPMQAFFLRTGVGAPVCDDAPDALIIQGPQGLTVDLNVNGADIRVGSTVVLRTLGVNDSDDIDLDDDQLGEVAGVLQIAVLDGEVIVNPDSDNPTIIPENETSVTCLSQPQNLGIDGTANDQLVTDACNGWTEPRAITDQERQTLRLVDDYPLTYPIPVFPEQSGAPTATTVVEPPVPPPTLTPVNTIDPNATLTPTNTPGPNATATHTNTPGPSPTPSNTPLPGSFDLTFDYADASFSGNQVTLTYRVRNLGPAVSSNFTVTGLRSSGVFAPFPNSTDDFFLRGMSWSGSYDDTTDTWTPFGGIGPGTFGAQLTMTMDILDGAYGKTFTAAPIINAPLDANPSNNQTTVTFTINSRSNLGVVVQNIPPVVAGESTSVTVVAQNLGGTLIRNLSVNVSASNPDVDLISGVATQGTFDGFTGIWTIPVLQASQSATLTITTLPAITTGGLNRSVTATISALNHTETTPGNETSADLFTPIVNIMDLGLLLDSVSPNLPYYQTGGSLTLSFDISNSGTADANNVTITDVLPPNLTYVIGSAAGAGVYSDTTDTWTIPQIMNGQTVTFSVSATIGAGAAGTIVSQSLTVNAVAPPESNMINNTLAYNLAVKSEQDLGVGVSVPSSQAGTNVVYAINAGNLGAGTVDNIVVSLTPPPGLSFVSSSVPLIGNDWIVGSLPGSGSANLTVTYFIPENQAAILQTLGASISSSSNVDSVTGNDISTGSTTPAYANVDVGFTNLSASPGPYLELAAHSLTYEVSNASAATPANNVVITNLLPPNVTFSTYTGPGTYTPGTDTLTIASIAPTSTVFLTFNFTFDSATSGLVLSTTANLTADNDSTPGNNNQAANFFVNTTADISVTVSPLTFTPAVGTPFNVDVQVTNTSGQTVTIDAVPYSVPAGLTINSGGGVWTVGTLAGGSSVTFTLNLTATLPTTGIAQAISAGPVNAPTNTDSINGNDSDSENVTPFLPGVDVGFNGLNIVNFPYEVGETIFITHTINNTDLATPAKDVTITDLLPSGVTFGSYSGPGTYTPGTDTLVIPLLAANSSANLSFTVTVDAGTGETLLSANTTLTALNDGSVGDDTNTIGIFISTSADLAVAATASTLTPLENVAFTATLTVTNTSTTQSVSGISLTYSTAAGLTVNTITPSVGSASLGTWSIPSLAPGGSATLTFNLTAPPPTVGIGQAITGSGLAGSTNVDGNNLNNGSTVTVTPTAPVVCNPVGVNSPAALVTAVENANNEGLCPGLNTITMTSGGFVMSAYAGSPQNALPPISSDITINGGGAYVNRTASGFRFARVTTGTLTINTADFQNFDLPGDNGGAFLIEGTGRLVLRAVTIRDGEANLGGAIYTSSSAVNSVDLINVTMWLNSASAGGGVYTAATNPINIAFTSLQGNSGGNIAGGGSSVINVKNNILVGSPTNCGTGVALVNNGGNAVNIADNVCTGLFIFSFILNSYGSPPLSPSNLIWTSTAHVNAAADCLDNSGTPVTTGAQGVARPQGPACDPGANESP